MDHYGPGFRGIEELDLANEAQKASGIAGNTVVRPAGKVEEAELSDLVVAFLRREWASVFPPADLMYPPSSMGTRGCGTEERAPLLCGEMRPLLG